MEPTKELIDDIYRDRVRRARTMTFEQKFLAGPQLFESVCQRMRDGIRMQFPDADDQRVEEILQHRLAIHRRLETVR
jgi:hypothetical protein